MSIILLFPKLLLCLTFQGYNITLWTRSYGKIEEGIELERGYSVINTPDGGYFIVGESYSSDSGNFYVNMVKINKEGEILWTRNYGRSFFSRGYSVTNAVVGGGYFVAGYTTGIDVYVLRIDNKWDTSWTRCYGGEEWDCGYSVISTPDGGCFVVGETYSFGAGGYDVYALKIDSEGKIQWSNTYGGSDQEYGYSVISTPDGGYLIVGSTYSSAKGYDILLIKTDANGNVEE